MVQDGLGLVESVADLLVGESGQGGVGVGVVADLVAVSNGSPPDVLHPRVEVVLERTAGGKEGEVDAACFGDVEHLVQCTGTGGSEDVIDGDRDPR